LSLCKKMYQKGIKDNKMLDKNRFVQDCRKIREQSPLVHCITNFVAMDFNANALLAIGASPLMSSCPEEMVDISRISKALVVNIGCLDSLQVEAMDIAVKAALSDGKRWVLDPVGVGASALRDRVAHHLAYDCHPSVIRGNASEIIALAGETITSHGVDAAHDSGDALEAAKSLATNTGAVVSVSGPVDYITDGQDVETISNGNEIMSRVTGMGCTATALTGAFLAIGQSPFEAALHAMAMMGVAGDMAYVKGIGTGSFRTAFIDALSLFDAETACGLIKE